MPTITKSNVVYLKEDFLMLFDYATRRLVEQKKFYSDIKIIRILADLVEKMPVVDNIQMWPINIRSESQIFSYENLFTIRIVDNFYQRMQHIALLSEAEKSTLQLFELKKEEKLLLDRYTGIRKGPNSQIDE